MAVGRTLIGASTFRSSGRSPAAVGRSGARPGGLAPWARIAGLAALVAFAGGPGAGGEARALAGEPQLAFVSGDPGGARIYLIRADGGGRRRLSPGFGEAVAPTWSRDGTRLAFVGATGVATQVFVVGADGSSLHRVTRPPASHMTPTWSPDGRALAFVETGTGGDFVLYVADLRGARPRRLVPGHAPAWSPDGRFIAFLDPRGGAAQLYLIAPSGGPARRVETRVAGVVRGVTGFAWSPDGRRIAYTSRSGPAQEEIRVVDLEGGAAQWLSTGYAPAWSPQGTHIAFAVSRVGSAYIAVSRAAGGGATAVTDPRGIGVRPAWSPDGRYLAYISVRGGDAGLYVMRPDGGSERRLDAVYADFSRGPLLAWRPR